MEPLPETREALDEFVSFGEPYIEELVFELAQRAAEVVPELIGLSLGVTHENLTFTLVSSNAWAASLDAAQYLEGGPCVDAIEEQAVAPIEASMSDPLDEERWQLFARFGSALGVGTSLSMLIYHTDGRAIGGVNLYASVEGAFSGKHEDLAQVLGGKVEEAVQDADLSFSTRLEAAAAPQRLRDARWMDVAVGLLSARAGLDVEQARSRLEGAAARAGITEALLARVVRLVLTEPDDLGLATLPD